MGKWTDLANNLKARDANALSEMDGVFGGGMSIENRIALANGRACDALSAIVQILEHLDKESERREGGT